MNDIKDRLKNRTDLEKLENDLVMIERLVDQGSVGEKTIKLVRQARRDLEAARSAHIDFFPLLKSPQQAERQAARREVDSRIALGEIKLFDPEKGQWRPVEDVLDEAQWFDENIERRDAETRQIEAQLQNPASFPAHLHQLHHLILRADELLAQNILSPDGKAGFLKAQEIYKSGCLHQSKMTNDIYTGTLEERFKALEEFKELIASGEKWILVAPKNIWLPVDQALPSAEKSFEDESKRLCEEAINRADILAQTNLKAAIQELYKALDDRIPYKYIHRKRLITKYKTMLAVYRKQEIEFPDYLITKVSEADKAGYINVREKNSVRMRTIITESHTWLNQFFHSTISRPVDKLLIEAENENTELARTVELIEMAVSLAKDALEGSIEIPEAMIRGAMILYAKGNTNRAKEMLTAATPLYTLERADKIHRHAVTVWLLGCIEYVLALRLEGYSHWRTARKLFEELWTQATRDHQLEKADWYRDRLSEMSTYAIQTFEEVYFNWMNQFDPIVLPESLNIYRANLDKQLGANQIVQLRKTLSQYLEESKQLPGHVIGWFAMVDAAFYEYEIKDYLTALDLLKGAWVGFQLSHCGAVVLWLSGLIQWWFPSNVTGAAENWEKSISIFQYLSKEADQKNQNNRHVWYDAQIKWMTASLKDWLQLTKVS